MFAKTSKLCFLSLSLLTALWGFLFARVNSTDLAAMKEKIREQKEAVSDRLFATTHQQRKGVVKDIWFTQEDESRLHYRISSISSLLTIEPKDKGFDLIEKLENMQCWMQDKLYREAEAKASPMQQVRFLSAKEGLYHYTLQQFSAQSVALSLYRLNGHELPQRMDKEKPFLKGIAEDISFAVSGKTPQFEAKHFKAELGGNP